MMNWSLDAMGRCLGITALLPEVRINAIRIDSRQVEPGDVFVALAGSHVDGHDFAAQAAARGATALIVQRPVPVGLPQLRVQDTFAAIVKLASCWRARHALPVVAVVGSNGKTSTREMIASILRASGFQPLVTMGNQNNHLGVCLSLLRLRPEHDVMVLELGANRPGEISALAELVRPTHAVFTNAGHDHEAGFGGPAGAARANGELLDWLPRGAWVVVGCDDAGWPIWRAQADGRLSLLPCSLRSAPEGGWLGAWSATAAGGLLHCHRLQQQFSLQVPGSHSGLNALLALAMTHALGADVDSQQSGLHDFGGVPGRLQRIPLAGGRTLINDAYNANPSSLAAAMAVLAQASGHRLLVLGQMAELGHAEDDWHRWAGMTAREQGIDAMWGVGPGPRLAVEGFGSGGRWFANPEDLCQALQQEVPPGATILLKGSRLAGLNEVSDALARLLGKEPSQAATISA